jgi:hypothetical protein
MSQEELDQVTIFDQLVAKTMTQTTAAQRLGLTDRQIRRKLVVYCKEGAKSLAHGARGKPGNRQLNPLVKEHALALVRAYYTDFKPTFASEKLAELHGVKVGHETLRLAMIEAGLWAPKTRKVIPHVWRERKACVGEMVQLDGSLHAWFEDRAPKCTLLAFIDDATSRVLWLEFCDGESTMNLMQATYSYAKGFGRPLSFYFDRGGVFKVNIHNENNDKLTQYERALKELEITVIHARSPQAKGRVERLFGTLQDRLVKELRLASISTIDEANRFVREVYIPQHNAKFAVAAREPQDRHRPLDGYNLKSILVTKEARKVNSDFTVQYRTRWFQLEKKQPTLVFPKNDIIVSEHWTGKITLTLRTARLIFQEIPKRPEKPRKERSQPTEPKKPWTPPANHPWRQYKIQKQDISILVH